MKNDKEKELMSLAELEKLFAEYNNTKHGSAAREKVLLRIENEVPQAQQYFFPDRRR